ncbi:MarR family transcriptional regulator [Streptomyces sp. NPDC007084]|uniref:MarR family transcriptional regulator n=1 Tax=Streptomyces sp. NPDC007084 TaxID=3154313 RepID=UPI003451462C
MAYENSISALPAPAHPMANPGYGKRAAPAEPGRPAHRAAGFGHLPPREAYVAAFIERLPEGATMDVKSLAKVLPLYGQQAVGSALNALSRAGHLRRVRRLAETGDRGTRWVFRTYWSRVARDDEWWARFLGGDESPDAGTPAAGRDEAPAAEQDGAPDDGAGLPAPAPARSTAYRALAQLGRRDERLTLSATDCADLAELAGAWFERGVTVDGFTNALTNGLPDALHAPRAFVARRLHDKLPPDLAPRPAAPAPDASEAPERPLRRAILECTDCGVPGRPEALPGGLCRTCASSPDNPAPTTTTTTSTSASTRTTTSTPAPAPAPAPDVRAHIARLRASLAAR